MAEPFVYLSQAWGDEVKTRLVKELSPDKMNNLSSSMTNRYTNCKGGADQYFHVSFENGAVASVQVGVGEGPEAEFIIQGDYNVFAQISQATLGAQRALMTGQLKLKGNMVKALKLASLVDRINKIIATIPTEF
jgi:putative sterol carrier protein